MSECVVRMEMPTKENPCKIAVAMQLDGWTFWICPILNARCLQPEGEDCPRNCPIICSLPEGHGRLVDADELYKKRYIVEPGDILASITVVDACYISGAQTIVPADAERSET